MTLIDLTLMVALSEDDEPVVCGAWETNVLDIIGVEETEQMFARARSQWLPDYVQWREVRITVDADAVMAAFRSPAIHAEVEA